MNDLHEKTHLRVDHPQNLRIDLSSFSGRQDEHHSDDLCSATTHPSFQFVSHESDAASVRSLKYPTIGIRDNIQSGISAESSSSGIGTMSGSNRLIGNISKTQDKSSYKKSSEIPLGLRKSETLDASAERFLGTRDSTDSPSASVQQSSQQQQQPVRRKPTGSNRADSPAVGGDLSGSTTGTGSVAGVTCGTMDNANESTHIGTGMNKSAVLNFSDTNGNSSRTVIGSHLSDSGRSGSLARSRKRARNDARRLGLKNSSAHTALLSSTKNGIRSLDADEDGDVDDDDDLGPDDEDDDDDSGTVPGLTNRRRLSSRPDFSDLDSPLDDMHTGTDLDTPYRGRQRRQTYQLPPRRRDSSLGGYGHSSFYGASTCAGTLPRRHLLDVSLTRATTIGAGDGTLRSAQRLAQSIRSGIIPPPPSEPPPATPLSGSLMSELGTIGVSTGGGPSASGLINPFALQFHNQQEQQRQAAALAAAVAASGGVHPHLFSTIGAQNPGLPGPYMLSASADPSQILQLQQQALIFQQQQQQLDAHIRQQQQQQQQQQQLLVSGLLQPTYSSHYGTLGRPVRTDSMGPIQPYLSAAALLSAQQQQQQARQYLAHNSNGLSGVVQSPSSTLAASEQENAIMNKSTSAQGGSGSVVYENSYNSFHRLLSNTLPPSISQDGLHGLLASSGIGMSETLTMNMNNASPHMTAARANTLGRTDTLSPVGPGNVNSMAAAVAAATAAANATASTAGSAPPPLPPPNHPGYDLVDTRTMESPIYGGAHSTDKVVVVSGTRKSKRRCPWYYWIISILVLAFLLALVLAISFSAEKRHLGDRLIERFAQDPAIIGLFDPNNPAVKLEPNRPVHVILDRMGVWSAEWHMRTSRYVRYNITVSSVLSSIGIFMRRSTMPTIVRYDIFDRISGRTLQPTPRSGRRLTRDVRTIAEQSAPTGYRSSSSSEVRETTRIHYLEEGIWFLAFVNDQPRPEPFTFAMGDAVMDAGCPNDCSNRGVCNRGNCDCVNGFKGPDCSVAELPKVCNGRGDYMDGSCQCYPEWKGRECEILWSECADPTCSGHGQCVTGDCQCYNGYAGESCEQRTCISANCTGHGICMDGLCRCFSGWSGLACDIPVPVMHTASFASAALTPERDVISRGLSGTDRPTTMSRMAISHTGSDFTRAATQLDEQATKACILDCGAHGRCKLSTVDQPACECESDWSGLLCDRKLCDPRCFEHGHCTNGTCVCQTGWNGKHCTLNGCPEKCSGVGRCVASQGGLYSCHCPSERKGSACQAKVELICDDHEDNDEDGLVDCLDPDCCASAHCRKLAQLDTRRGGTDGTGGSTQNRSLTPAAEDAKQGCAHSEPAQYHLLITPMAQADSTFYGQLEFLLKREQIVMRNFDPRRISVIRGTVRQSDGTAFWGCRVFDRLKAKTGYTLTDEQGRFDLPVDGGSVVQLEFLRFPTERFSAIQPVYVPVNEIITLGDFYLHDASRISSGRLHGGSLAPSPVFHDLWAAGLLPVTDSSPSDPRMPIETGFPSTMISSTVVNLNGEEPGMACEKHDLTQIGGLPVWGDQVADRTTVCIDPEQTMCLQNGVLTFAIPIQDSRVRLIYRSDRTVGYRPVLMARLLGQVIPDGLHEIHFVVDVAGLRQTKRLEPEPGQMEFFHWNKTDGYNRTVYGLVNAKVSVGYIYTGCSHVFWEHRTVPLLGHELTESGLANLKIDLVHLYAVNHGIVYRGDGSHLFLKHTDWHVVPVLGSRTTRRKPNICDYCSTNQTGFGSAVLRLPALITDSLGHVVAADGSRLRWLQSPESTHGTFRPSESLDGRAQRSFLSNDRRLWFTTSQFPLDFLSVGFDELEQMDYYLSPHPSYLALERRFGASDPGVLDSGLFLSHTRSKSIWWLSDSPEPIAQPVLSLTCKERASGLLPVPDLCTKHELTAPHGVAVSTNDLYFADGNLIFAMPLDGIPGVPRSVRLVVGRRDATWTPAPCDHAQPGLKMTLKEPTHMVYSAFEDAIYFVENTQVYRLHLASQMVSLAAGRLEYCEAEADPLSQTPLATTVLLSNIRGLGVSPEGDLYVAESHRVWLRRADGRLYAVAGRTVDASIDDDEFVSPDSPKDLEHLPDFGLARNMQFSNITAIAVSIYGELFVADSEHGMIYRVHYQLPRPSATTFTYRVVLPETDEAYTFNQNGQLLQTENAITQMTLHLVDYRANAIYGWVSDIRGNNVNLRFGVHRDTQGRLRYLQSPTGLQYNITLDPGPQQCIREVTDPIRGARWTFVYSHSGLLTQLRRPQDTAFTHFQYSPDSGRLERILFPNGMVVRTGKFDTLSTSHSVTMRKTSARDRSTNRQGKLLYHYGEPTDPWSVHFVQNYLGTPSGSSRRLARLLRRIRLPDRANQSALISSVVWTFDRNAKISPSSRLVRHRQRRQIPRPILTSSTQLTRTLQVGHTTGWSDWVIDSSRTPQHSRIPRSSSFSYLSSALSLSGYRAAAGTESVEWQYHKTLVVNGFDVLHVKFDWARQLETYQRASTGHVLLQIVYNADFQPMIFNASGTTNSLNSRADYLPSDTGRTRSRELSAAMDGGFVDSSTGSSFTVGGSSGPAPLSLTYNSNGQLNAFHWGSAIYRFAYDAQNRIKAADLGSPKETVTYQYTDERLPYQPSVISVSGLGSFKLFYANAPLSPLERHVDSAPSATTFSDLPIGLTRVLTPSGLRRDFYRLVGVRTHQLRFTPWPGSSAPWIYEWGQDVNTFNSPASSGAGLSQPDLEFLRFIWPSGYRQLVVLPEQNQIVYDKTLIQWFMMGLEHEAQLNHLDSAPLVHMSDISSGHRWSTWRTYRGTLLTAARTEQQIPGARKAHPNLGGLLHARHQYSYNENLNLVGIHTQLYTQASRSDTETFNPIPEKIILDEQTVSKYDSITGQLLSVSDLDIVHRASSICVTYAPKSLQLCRQLDNHGRLKQVILYPLSSRRDPLYNLTVVYRPNSLDAVQQREEQRGQVPRWVNFVHGPGGRLEALDREEAGSSLRSHSVLVHNSEGRLARLRIAVTDPQLHQGNPMAPDSTEDTGPTSRSEELQFVYDPRGLLKRRGNWQYTFDDDGFLTERRLHNDRVIDRFAYNSKGLLIWAERKLIAHSDGQSGVAMGDNLVGSGGPSSGSTGPDTFHNLERSPLEDDIGSRREFRVQYVYDAQDRLIVVRDTLIVRDLMQYFYADPTHPHRVTHVFNHGRLVTFRLHYDPVNGHLIAVEEFARLSDPTMSESPPMSTLNGQDESQQTTTTGNQKHVYFVITNHEGAPTAMFSENGKPSWTAEYSATGSRRLSLPNRNKYFGASILEDANIPLGHAGCLVDVHTGFLFCSPTYRAYDPSGATFVSPDWRRLVSDRLPELYRDPSVLDTHRWGSLEQNDHGLGPVGLFARVAEAIQHPSWWLNLVGFRLDGVLPRMDPGTGRLNRPDGRMIRGWELPVLPMQFSLTGTSAVSDEDTGPSIRLLNDKVERLSVIQSSRLTTGGIRGTGLPDFFLRSSYPGDMGRVQLLPAQAMFDSEVILELNEDHIVQVRSSGPRADYSIGQTGHSSPFESGKLADLLLSGTRLMDWWTMTDSPTNRLFVQSFFRLGDDISSLVDDLTLLGLRLPAYHRPTGHNLTVVPTGGHNEIWLTRGSLQWRFRFVSSWTDAWEQLAWDSRRRGEQLAWSHEASVVKHLDLMDPSRYPESATDRMAESSADIHFLGLNYLWTFKQAYQLARQGQLAGYRWVPVVGQSVPRDLLSNGTAWTRLYGNPGIYQLRVIDSQKQWRTKG